MVKSDVIKLEIPCSPEFITISRKAVEAIASRLALTDEQVEDLKLAVGEACSNAVKFSGPDKSAVRVLYRIELDRLEIEVCNTGTAFSRDGGTQKPPVEMLPEGGLGLYLIDQVMDELKISCGDGETTVKMVKQLKR